ncbi:OadG family protein [bacterium]|nr:OadG family protein [bacterium]
MVQDGLTLALVGMSVVYVFLTLLVVIISVTARILKMHTDAELAAIEADAIRRPGLSRQKIVAVISAALALHRARRRGM